MTQMMIGLSVALLTAVSLPLQADQTPEASMKTNSSAPYEKVAEKKLFNGESLFEFRLQNGLRVLHVARSQAKVLTYQTWFNVGSLHEKLDPKLQKTGLAHLFEHMMFRGSEKYPDGKFDAITSRIGGEKQNATTHFYRTNYYESVPSIQLEKIMELESDRMRALKLTKDIIEKEKGAVVGEYRRHMDNPASVAWDEMLQLMFTTSPFRWTVLGTEEEIKGFSVEEAQYFYKTFYSPNNATLIVIGDVTEKPLLDLVVKYYGDMPRQEIPQTVVPEEPEQKKERRKETTHKQATSEILLVAYRGPSVDSPDIIPLQLLGTHLSRGMESRLRKLLVDSGIAVGASAACGSRPDLFEFFVQLAEGHKAEEALRIIDKEVVSLQKTKVSEPQFQRALNQELLNLYTDIGENSELGNWLGEYLMLPGSYMRGFEIIDGFSKISSGELQRVAKKFLHPQARSIVIIRPEKKKKA